MTSMKGVDVSFDECLKLAKICDVDGVKVPVIHINHLIGNKKAVALPKDQLDVIYLEKLQKLRGEESPNLND